jgi:acetate kinase
MTRVLVVNRGSSSLKYQVLERKPDDDGRPVRLAIGLVERIGSSSSRLTHQVEGEPEQVHERPVRDSAAAVGAMLDSLAASGLLASLDAVGHRVVHGGARFTGPTLVDDEVEQELAGLSELAPLHNPSSLEGLRALRAAVPDVPHVAVFDTAFHATLPPYASSHAIPQELAGRYGVRRWGFHGTSVRYVVQASAALLDLPLEQVNLVVCHIGNGASVTAVEAGRSVDTSMGMTPLEGLVMGTRSGDIDPAVVPHLTRTAGLSVTEVEHLLNFDSGLSGLCGDADIREVRRRAAGGNSAAQLALDVYTYRLRKYIGAYLAVVPDLDAVVFTGGVGEHDRQLRAEVIDPLGHLGLRLDGVANSAAVGPASPVRIGGGERMAVLVVPTNEEAEIASQVLASIDH